jgi:hypothetical protein
VQNLSGLEHDASTPLLARSVAARAHLLVLKRLGPIHCIPVAESGSWRHRLSLVDYFVTTVETHVCPLPGKRQAEGFRNAAQLVIGAPGRAACPLDGTPLKAPFH